MIRLSIENLTDIILTDATKRQIQFESYFNEFICKLHPFDVLDKL